MKITLLTGKTFEIERAAGLPLKVVSPPRCRRLALRIDPKERQAVLNLPPSCPVGRALKFVEENRGWIEAHLLAVPESRPFADGAEISLFGEKVTIRHCPDLKGGVFVENGELKVSGEAAFLPRRVRDFIRREAAGRLLELSRQKAALIGCRVNRVTIKDTKSRWGSCSSLNNINYNWRIALAPMNAIDYLIAHETAHLRHRDHSKAFWNCVKTLCPFAESGRRWLKQNSGLLYAYE